jgi:tRNA (cytidine/uridine-2'-O-)-methyltransferase
MEVGPANVLRLPMQLESRSLNLSNTVSIVTYEAWRQLGFNTASIL